MRWGPFLPVNSGYRGAARRSYYESVLTYRECDSGGTPSPSNAHGEGSPLTGNCVVACLERRLHLERTGDSLRHQLAFEANYAV